MSTDNDHAHVRPPGTPDDTPSLPGRDPRVPRVDPDRAPVAADPPVAAGLGAAAGAVAGGVAGVVVAGPVGALVGAAIGGVAGGAAGAAADPNQAYTEAGAGDRSKSGDHAWGADRDARVDEEVPAQPLAPDADDHEHDPTQRTRE